MFFRIFFALVTLAILGLAIAGSVYVLEKVEKPKAQAVREIKESAPPKPIDPGIGEFELAMAEVAGGELQAARDRFRHIIRYFPNSERYGAARRLCSELNLDMVVHPAIAEPKLAYEVKSGDNVSAIASQHDCTLEYIKRVNGLVDFKIRPGDQLVVRPLDFAVEIQVEKMTLTLLENDEFFAEFDLVEARLPSGVNPPYDDRVRSKAAWVGRASIRVTTRGYEEASKEIRLAKRGVVLTSPSEETAEGSEEPEGFFMDPVDIDELNMLLRVGTPIHVAP